MRKKQENNEIRSGHIAMARESCAVCRGTGLRASDALCNCVYRRMFRAVMNKARDCDDRTGAHAVRLDGITSRPINKNDFWCKTAAYKADISLTAKRTLPELEWSLFSMYFLRGADWQACCRRLGMNRHTFYRSVWRIEATLGRVWLEMKPFGLYPPDEYFAQCTSRMDVRPLAAPEPRYPNGIPLRPPLAERAPAIESPEPKPAPVLVPAPKPPASPAERARELMKTGRSLSYIADSLTRSFAAPNGGSYWYISEVKRLLMGQAEAAA